MRKALIVDVQSTAPDGFPNGDNGYYFDKIRRENIPVAIALAPYQRDNWQKHEDKIGEIVSRKGSHLFVEGLVRICAFKDHRIRDPHHETICPSFFSGKVSYDAQIEKVEEGVEFIEKTIGVRPDGFVPPQHLWNEDIVDAVRQRGLKYLVTNAMLSRLEPYNHRRVVVVPSGSVKHGRNNNPVIHAYMDRIKGKEEEVFGNIVPLEDIPVLPVFTPRHSLNEDFVRVSKQARDFKRLVRYVISMGAKPGINPEELRRERFDSYARHLREIFGE